jgi:SAM-dependent methyltransferase
MPDSAQLEAMYRELPEGALQYQASLNAAWDWARKALLRELSSVPSPAILDVGCYDGQFLCSLPRSWRTFGLEPSVRAAEVARTRGVAVVGSAFPALVHGDEFHAVCLFDVLEHVPNPARELRAALSALRPGGVVVVSTGDMDAWTWRWANTAHWYLETPQHVSVASRRFFRWFATTAGVSLERMVRIPHQRGGWHLRPGEAVNVLYFGSTARPRRWRLLRGLIRRLPPWRAFAHSTSMITASHLRDHLIVTMRRPTEGGLAVEGRL